MVKEQNGKEENKEVSNDGFLDHTFA